MSLLTQELPALPYGKIRTLYLAALANQATPTLLMLDAQKKQVTAF
jgi:hypothetical protein